MRGICSECGDRKIQNQDGMCKNRHGCEHRQYQHRARTERLLAEMEQQEWHGKVRRHIEHYDRQTDNGYAPPGGSALLNFWMNDHPSQTNQWVDKWLHGDDEDED